MTIGQFTALLNEMITCYYAPEEFKWSNFVFTLHEWFNSVFDVSSGLSLESDFCITYSENCGYNEPSIGERKWRYVLGQLQLYSINVPHDVAVHVVGVTGCRFMHKFESILLKQMQSVAIRRGTFVEGLEYPVIKDVNLLTFSELNEIVSDFHDVEQVFLKLGRK